MFNKKLYYIYFITLILIIRYNTVLIIKEKNYVFEKIGK